MIFLHDAYRAARRSTAKLRYMKARESSIVRFLGSPILALVLALIFEAVALTGKLGVNAARVLFGLALAIVIYRIYQLRMLPIAARIAMTLIAAAFIWFLGHYFTPDAVPSYSGKLVAHNFVYSPGDPSARPLFEVGDSNFYINTVGPPTAETKPLIGFFEDSDLTIETIDGKAVVSTKIRDQTGDLVAELVRNEWKVAPSPKTWDRNYSDDALEIINPAGRVVLQLKVLQHLVRIQGEWWDQSGHGVRIVMSPYNNAVLFIKLAASMSNINDFPISPMFQYPSDLHLGELAEPNNK
jgi:hypothetical protein